MDIIKLKNLNTELSIIQDYFIDEAINNTLFYFNRYSSLKNTKDGNYISSDLFKKTFDIYNESINNVRKYSTILHNSAAYLAGSFFNYRINNSNIKKCIIVSGCPGAGKSTYIDSLNINNDTIIYEGNILNNDIIDKINLCISKNISVKLIILNSPTKLCIINSNERYIKYGIPTPINLMAKILSSLYERVLFLTNKYNLKYEIINKDIDNNIINKTNDIDILNIGNYNDIFDKLCMYRKKISV